MAQPLADGEPGIAVRFALFLGQVLGHQSTGGRAGPAGQFLVAVLCVGMTQTVHVGKPGAESVALINAHRVDVVVVTRDQNQSLPVFAPG